MSQLYRQDELSLLSMFGQFYLPIAQIKEAISSSDFGDRLAEITHLKERVSNEDQAEVISKHLHQIIDEQEKLFKTYGSAAEIDAYQKAKYVMVALADEVFLMILKWNGRDEWFRNMLEKKVFETALSGDLFFEYLKDVLDEKNRTPLTDQLASVFLLALRLGFQGVHRFEDNNMLNQYRKRLYRFIGNVDPKKDDDRSRASNLFSSAYQSLLTPLVRERLAPISKWRKACFVTFMIYLLISGGLWLYTVWPIITLLNQ